jgi:phosphate-selective porin
MRPTRLLLSALILTLVPAPGALANELLDRVSINGYAALEFEKQLGDEGFGDPNGSFDADQFDLVFNIQASDRIRVAADISWEHGTATEDDRGNQALEYGFVEYTAHDLFKVRFGKMFTPFGIFNEIHTAKPAFLTVKEAPSLNQTERVVEGAFRFYPRWGAGIGINGSGVLGGKNFNYDVLFANGENETTNPFEEDDNTAKSVTGRFRIEPTDTLRLGTSFYYDSMEHAAFDSIWSQGLELEWTYRKFRVQAEAAWGSLGRREGGESIHQMGWYIQPSWHFDNGLTLYLRYDSIDPDGDVDDDQGSDFIAGLNYELSKNFQFKLENNWFQGGSATEYAALPGRDYQEIKAAVVMGF